MFEEMLSIPRRVPATVAAPPVEQGEGGDVGLGVGYEGGAAGREAEGGRDGERSGLLCLRSRRVLCGDVTLEQQGRSRGRDTEEYVLYNVGWH